MKTRKRCGLRPLLKWKFEKYSELKNQIRIKKLKEQNVK
jgi:hypothetical protein